MFEAFRSGTFTNEVRSMINKMREKRLSKEGFEAGIGGSGQQNVQGSFCKTPNYSNNIQEPWGSEESPNTERSGSKMDGTDHQMNSPIGDEENTYPMYEDGSVKEKHDGRRITLGKIHTGTGFNNTKRKLDNKL